MSRVRKFNKILLLAFVGIVIGIFLVPRTSVYGVLWSSIERMAAAQGVGLNCTDPKFHFTSIETGPCNIRAKAFGVSAEFLSVSLVGLFPPRAAIATRIFNEDCNAEFSSSSFLVKRCGFDVTEVPQLVGLGFTAGRVLFTGALQLAKLTNNTSSGSGAASPEYITGAFEGYGIEHPTLSTSKLGFGSQARFVVIPAFSHGAMKGNLRVSGTEQELIFSDLSTSIVKATSARVSQRKFAKPTDAAFSSNETLQAAALFGNIDFQLIGSGITQYGPLVRALAQGDVSQGYISHGDGVQTPSASSEAADDQNRYTAVISGTLGNPSFRVLKSTKPR